MAENNSTSKEKSKSVFTLTDFSSKTVLTEKGELDYNPFENRDQINGASTGGSLAHLLKSSLGSGILAMPLAFKNAGLLFGLFGTLAAGFLCTHCVHILVKTSHDICQKTKHPYLGFAETAEKVFENGPLKLRPWSNFAKQFVDGALMATYYAASCVYIVFIASSFQSVINYDFQIDWNIRVYIAMTIIPILFIGQIRNLKYLVPFSAMANIFIVIVFGITLYYMFNEPLKFSDKPLFSSWSQIPLFFATVIFAMEGIGAVMPVENSMKSPQHFLGCPGVLNTAMGTVIVLYTVIGFFGYVKYGDKVLGSITLNLQEGQWIADTAKILMAVSILFTYGLQFYIPNDILWKKISHKFPEDKQNIVQILLRTGIILITGGVSAAIPDLEPFISLVGSIFFSLLGILIPSVVQTVFLYPNNLGCCKWVLVKNTVLSIIAVCALVAGSYVSIKDIIKLYSK